MEMVEAGWSDAQVDCRRAFEENSHPMWVAEAREVMDVSRAALNNASKHASPKVVSILIHRNSTEVRLVIEDDGKGFDVSETPSEAQLGLVGMRERAHLVGGSMTVESAPGNGTTICISVPLLGPKPVRS